MGSGKGRVLNPIPKGWLQRETRGSGVWAPFVKKRPLQHQLRPQQTNYWDTPTRKPRKMHQPRGPTSNDAPTCVMQGETGDCPEPRQENNAGQPPQHQPQPQQTKHWPPAHTRSNVHRPHSRADNDDPTHSAKGRTGDSPRPHKETNEGRNVTQRGLEKSVQRSSQSKEASLD